MSSPDKLQNWGFLCKKSKSKVLLAILNCQESESKNCCNLKLPRKWSFQQSESKGEVWLKAPHTICICETSRNIKAFIIQFCTFKLQSKVAEKHPTWIWVKNPLTYFVQMLRSLSWHERNLQIQIRMKIQTQIQIWIQEELTLIQAQHSVPGLSSRQRSRVPLPLG